MKPEDCERIHRASLALLADPGIRLEHDEVAARLLRAGARPGAGPQVVRLPAGLIADALAAAPRTVELAGRGLEPLRLSAASTPRVWSAPALHLWRRGEHRPLAARDMAAAARLLDSLPAIDGVFGLSMADVPPAGRDAAGLRIMAENTRKHIRVLCSSIEGASALVEMKDAGGAGPWFSLGFTAHGPLRWTHLALEIFSRTAGHGLPVTLNGEPMAGVSGPVTLAGAAAVGNAEILAGLAVNQLLEPGRPCIYNLGLAHVFDMRTALAVTGGPENHLLAGLSAALGRHYGLPSCSWVSTESMAADSQAALEKAMGWLSHLRSGVSLIWGVGQLESEMTFSPAQAVIDDEIVRYARRMAAGVRVDDDSLALDVTRAAGIGGSFLELEHTMAHFRAELFEPALLWRRPRAAWDAAGRPSLADAAEDRADALMARPSEAALPEDRSRAIRAIERRLNGTVADA